MPSAGKKTATPIAHTKITVDDDTWWKFWGHRPTLRQEWTDIGIIGGIYGLLFFTTLPNLLPSVLAFSFSPSVDAGSLTKMFGLMLATFPLAIGTAIIVGGFMGNWFEDDGIYMLLGKICIVLLLTSMLSALLGLGSISLDELKVFFFGSDTQNCFSLDCSSAQQPGIIAQYSSPILLVAVPLGLLSTFYAKYGFATFFASVVLGVYLAWAFVYKFAQHQQSAPVPEAS